MSSLPSATLSRVGAVKELAVSMGLTWWVVVLYSPQRMIRTNRACSRANSSGSSTFAFS